ncbi:hypothetical protein [Enterococcus sp. UD-01]|uniref:hypothetical protein n=1 Tax=Enterococcus sp. UD-01 TaxID=3373911 RepID=UPI0038351DD1
MSAEKKFIPASWLEVAEWLNDNNIDDTYVLIDKIMYPIKDVSIKISELKNSDWYYLLDE